MINSSTALDMSLYQLAVTTDSFVQPLLVSPSTLKSLVKALMDVLIEQQLSCTLCVKLPPGQVWLSEIEQYQKLVAPEIIYLYNSIHEPSKTKEQVSRERNRNISIQNQKAQIPDRMREIHLPAKSKLNPEYFLLILSAKFCALVLAHKAYKKDPVANLISTKKSTLVSVCLFERQPIQKVLQGIRHEISVSDAPELAKSTADDLLTNWDSLFAPPQAADSDILIQLLNKQLQRQEESRNHPLIDNVIAAKTAALKRQNQGLMDELQFKDELLSNLAQEMRTPLTNMKTALKLIESPHLKIEQRKRYMQMLQTECDRQSSLLNGLLELVQLDKIAPGTVSQAVTLADIVPGVVSTYQAIAQEKGIRVGYTIPANLPAVSCLETWVRQIVINLLHNSIKFTHSGGQVWVKAKQQGEYVQLEFGDTGVGIAAHELPKIFDRFYRGRPAMGEDVTGAGLGLTLVQQILLRCGGSISVTSKLGEGSIFKVLLPVKL